LYEEAQSFPVSFDWLVISTTQSHQLQGDQEDTYALALFKLGARQAAG
jgi:hypothetical protein